MEKSGFVKFQDKKPLLNSPGRDFDKELSMGLYHYARENLALVNVYIKDPAVTQVKRDQKVPLIWFVANIGGILVSFGHC